MPYPMTRNEKGEYCVNEKCYVSRSQALKYQRALYANVPDAGSAEFETKDHYGAAKVDPNDPRSNYGPLRGSNTKACANCQWFCAHDASCDLVWGEIVATGGCDLWLAEEMPHEPEPIPVVIVENAESESSDTPIIAWLKRTFGKKATEELPENGFRALPDGKWVSFFTNNFRDKAGQIFSERSHDQYIEWLEKGLIPYPDLWYWHVPGTKHGQAEWVGRVDHVVIAAGSFDDTPLAHAFRKEYQKNPKLTSHTYGFPKQGLQNDVYHAYFTVEISPLPVGKEANEWTPFMEVREMPVTAEKIADLERILGKDMTAQVLGKGKKISEGLVEAGFDFKQVEGLPTIDNDARNAIRALAEASSDAMATSNKAFETKLDELLTAVKEIQKAETGRNAKVVELETFVKEQFKLEPRATRNADTVVADTDPMLALLRSKQQGATVPDPNANVFDQLSSMILSSIAPKQP